MSILDGSYRSRRAVETRLSQESLPADVTNALKAKRYTVSSATTLRIFALEIGSASCISARCSIACRLLHQEPKSVQNDIPLSMKTNHQKIVRKRLQRQSSATPCRPKMLEETVKLASRPVQAATTGAASSVTGSIEGKPAVSLIPPATCS